jgi:uncharacterized protein YbaR (Trm112 family)
MRERHIGLLVDPTSGRPLQISRSDQRTDDEIIEGELREPVSGVTYPIAGGISASNGTATPLRSTTTTAGSVFRQSASAT